MGVVIASSNYLVTIQINDWLTWASFTWPLVFLVTDLSNRLMGLKFASKVVAWGLVFGLILSFATAPTRIAIASCSAYIIAGILNLLVFDRLRKVKLWWRAPLISSGVAAICDTFLFFSIAFFGTDVPWVTLGLGDLAVKLLMVTVFLAPYRVIVSRLLPYSVNAA